MNSLDRNQKSEGIYSLLQQLPIMRGASVARIREVAGHLRLNFRKALPGEAIVAAGSQAEALVCTLSGSTEIQRGGKTTAFEGPQMLFPEALFGLDTRFPQTVTAATEVSILEIPKDDFRKMLAMDSVFLYNYLNAVCTRAQRAR
ncbi:MAG: cyclic nucleotide-binding domain-containing protein [Muribaculaceae bacterium]|nr:cyclic nucleotide-binding domain-containing protein [Muribaculaceae bacterium]